MKALRGVSGLLQGEGSGLLKTGAVSLVFHLVILAFLSLSLGSGGGSSIYRFTIRPYFAAGDGMAKGGAHPGLVRPPAAATAQQAKIAARRMQQGISREKKEPAKHEQAKEAASAITVAAAAKEARGADPALAPKSMQAKADSAEAGMGQTGKGLGQGSGRGQGGSGSGFGEGEEGFGWGLAGLSSPRYAHNPKPLYPQEARAKGYQGKVLLRVEILASGLVGQIAVKKSSGCEALDHSALAAVKEWRFIPAKKGEVAVPVWVIIPVKFQLL
jgi:TonB family protein